MARKHSVVLTPAEKKAALKTAKAALNVAISDLRNFTKFLNTERKKMAKEQIIFEKASGKQSAILMNAVDSAQAVVDALLPPVTSDTE